MPQKNILISALATNDTQSLLKLGRGIFKNIQISQDPNQKLEELRKLLNDVIDAAGASKDRLFIRGYIKFLWACNDNEDKSENSMLRNYFFKSAIKDFSNYPFEANNQFYFESQCYLCCSYYILKDNGQGRKLFNDIFPREASNLNEKTRYEKGLEIIYFHAHAYNFLKYLPEKNYLRLIKPSFAPRPLTPPPPYQGPMVAPEPPPWP